ncbi:MAG: NAD(+) synthase, partial [Acidobacteria bacterium]|nr:NAD(+) synthase [Acidobacteriota bacterium]
MNFYSPYAHGFLRVAVCVPEVRLAQPTWNAERILLLARQAAAHGTGVVLFPELGLSGYSNEDLFQQKALLAAVERALKTVVEGSRDLAALLLVGAPLSFDDRLFNCAVVIQQGRIL